jgi:hypothetical protein
MGRFTRGDWLSQSAMLTSYYDRRRMKPMNALARAASKEGNY